MIKGKVKWYDEIKGFGFIETEEGKDIFVHRTNIMTPNQSLKDNQEVVFEFKQSEKGFVAINVKLAG